MKRIAYLVGAKPRKLDDCLDFSQRVKPLVVSVDLIANEVVSEMCISRQLVATFFWDFPNRNVRCEKVFGVCFAHETKEKQQSSVAKANRRLEACLRELEAEAIEVLGGQKRFDYSLVETCG